MSWEPEPSARRVGSITSRRELIRRAALVGTAAWTAPLVIDSITSPAGALTPCTCANTSSYTGAKIEGISPSSGACPPSGTATTVTGTLGFTSAGNRCGVNCWTAANGNPNTATGAVPTFTCATNTITLPNGCTFGDKGMVAVFLGGPPTCAGNYFVETDLTAYSVCAAANGPMVGGAIAVNATTFQLPSTLALNKLSHVNLVYCCC